MNKPCQKIDKVKVSESIQKMQDQLLLAKIEGNTKLIRIIEKCIKKVEKN